MGLEIGAMIDANGNAISSQVNGSQQALDVGVNVAGVQVDPRAIRALTIADTVSAVQSGTWNITNISGVISLPTGAATEASLAAINGKLNSLGQKAMVASVPVVLASDQSSIPVSITPTRGVLTDHSGVTTLSSAVLAPANANRNYLFIQLLSGNAWINFGSAATADSPSIKLTSGSVFTMEGNFLSNQAVNIIGATSGLKFVAKEG